MIVEQNGITFKIHYEGTRDNLYIIKKSFIMEDSKFIKLLQKSKNLSVKDRNLYFQKLENVVKQSERRDKLKKIWKDV